MNSFEVVGLKEMGIHEDIAETGMTLEENALIKSQYIFGVQIQRKFMIQ